MEKGMIINTNVSVTSLACTQKVSDDILAQAFAKLVGI